MRWISCICQFISLTSFAVLVNGFPLEFFSASRGLGGFVGGPISLLLFLLVMKVFTMMLGSAIAGGLLSKFSVGRMNSTTINVSHLLFFDDSIIFCDSDCEQAMNLWCILVRFKVVSGLRVNLVKTL